MPWRERRQQRRPECRSSTVAKSSGRYGLKEEARFGGRPKPPFPEKLTGSVAQRQLDDRRPQTAYRKSRVLNPTVQSLTKACRQKVETVTPTSDNVVFQILMNASRLKFSETVRDKGSACTDHYQETIMSSIEWRRQVRFVTPPTIPNCFWSIFERMQLRNGDRWIIGVNVNRISNIA